MQIQAQQAGQRPVRLGFDSYSLRAFRWKAPQILDYAAGLKLDSVQLASLGDFENLEPAYLAKVREQADRAGMALDGGSAASVLPRRAGTHAMDRRSSI